jgi:fatty-acid desaturase
VVDLQQRWLLPGYLVFGLLVPGLVGAWSEGDFTSGFAMGALWIGVIGRFLSWHAIWTINSLSHWEFDARSATAQGAGHRAVGLVPSCLRLCSACL